MAQPETTFWFWYGSECIGAVRLPASTSKEDARTVYLAQHERLPLNFPPLEYAVKLRCAEIRIYSGGN